MMELLQCDKVCVIGGDELHRPPIVALRSTDRGLNMNSVQI